MHYAHGLPTDRFMVKTDDRLEYSLQLRLISFQVFYETGRRGHIPRSRDDLNFLSFPVHINREGHS